MNEMTRTNNLPLYTVIIKLLALGVVSELVISFAIINLYLKLRV